MLTTAPPPPLPSSLSQTDDTDPENGNSVCLLNSAAISSTSNSSTGSNSSSTASSTARTKSKKKPFDNFDGVDVATLMLSLGALASDDEGNSSSYSQSDNSQRSNRQPRDANNPRRSNDSEEDDDEDSEYEDNTIDDSSDAESTSCSENSFEMSSATSYASTLNKAAEVEVEASSTFSPAPGIVPGGPSALTTSTKAVVTKQTVYYPQRPGTMPQPLVRRGPTTSYSMDSFLLPKHPPLISPQAREQISQAVTELDTALPQLDFKSLEEKLSTAAREHEALERRRLGDEVRRRLALQYDELTAGPLPAVNTRPQRSNYAFRLHAAKKLQICYMNDLAEDDEDNSLRANDTANSDSSDGDEEDDDEPPSGLRAFIARTAVPKSKSAPSFARNQPTTPVDERFAMLQNETQMMLRQAKRAAKMQMEVEKQARQQREDSMDGGLKKYTRVQLRRMKAADLKRLVSELEGKIDGANTELVSLLMEKDSLYMEQDSMLVDIEDAIQHSVNSESFNVPEALVIRSPSSSTASNATTPSSCRAGIYRAPHPTPFPSNNNNNNNGNYGSHYRVSKQRPSSSSSTSASSDDLPSPSSTSTSTTRTTILGLPSPTSALPSLSGFTSKWKIFNR